MLSETYTGRGDFFKSLTGVYVAGPGTSESVIIPTRLDVPMRGPPSDWAGDGE